MSLLEDLRIRVGVAADNTSKDAFITASKDAAFSLMGNYCDRIFLYQADSTEVFTHSRGDTLSLKRYPIETVTSIIDESGNQITDFHVDADTGLIRFDSAWAFHQVTVTSTGGFDEDVLPSDLLMAFYSTFDVLYASAIGTSQVSSTEISSITIADVGTIRYNTETPESAYGVGSFLPSTAKALLEKYKRLQC
jgi:hypothetical protein